MNYKVQIPCKVCGKLFTPCDSSNNSDRIFQWESIACSKECGNEYFKLVLEERAKTSLPKHNSETGGNKKVVKKKISDITDNKDVENVAK